MIVGMMLLVGVIMFNGIHQIPEGYVGVYFRGGALLDSVTGPGWHTKLPMVTSYDTVQVTVQTDAVNNVPCGTQGGVIIHFEQIEVVNRLNIDHVYETVKNYTVNYDKTWIYDKIHHEINQFCSKHTLHEVYIEQFDELDEHLAEVLQSNANKWAPGIEIISIRITKPTIPKELEKNYIEIESQKTKLSITKQQQTQREWQAETQRREAKIKAESVAEEAKIKAESEAEIQAIEMKKQVLSKESLKQMEAIENEIYRLRENGKADARHYGIMKQIEAEQAQLTPAYLQRLAIEAMTNNTKMYFGNSIPSFI